LSDVIKNWWRTRRSPAWPGWADPSAPAWSPWSFGSAIEPIDQPPGHVGGSRDGQATLPALWRSAARHRARRHRLL